MYKLALVVCCLIFKVAYAVESPIPAIWHAPPANDHFIGREKELAELGQLLRNHHKAIIVGVGGVGKTQLAKSYVHSHEQNYKIVWWFDGAKNMDDQLSNLAQQLNKHSISSIKVDTDKISASALLLYVKEALRTTDKTWLIIFDNIENTNLIKDYIPEAHDRHNKDIIITSRNSNEASPALHLNRFSPKEAQDFLTSTTTATDVKNLAELARTLDFYPIALAQAAAYIKTNNMQASEYISRYKRDPASLWKNERSLLAVESNYFDLDQRTIETAINLNLKTIKNDGSISSQVIEIISLIKVALVPEYFLKDIIVINGKSEEEYQAAIRTLKRYSLIEEQEEEGKKYYWAHDLVKAIVRLGLIDKQDHNRQKKLVTLYASILQALCNRLNKPWGEIITYINENAELINIANTVAISAHDDKIAIPQLAELQVSLLEHNNMIFHLKSNYPVYQEIAKNGFDLLEVQKLALPLALEARYYFDSIFADFVYESPAIKALYERKLLELIASLEKNKAQPEDLFLALINMAKFYLFKGDISQGMHCIDKAYALLKKVDNINYQADFWYTITWLHIEKGDYEKANEFIETFFQITKHNKIYPLHLYAMNMRASINLHLKNLKKSFLLASECYQKAGTFFQSSTSNIAAESLITLARYYKETKNYVKAKESIQKSIAVLDVIFGNSDIDPSQAVAHTLLGEIYEELQQYKEAYEEYTFAEKYYSKLYKGKVSDIHEVSKLYANFAILGLKINDNSIAKQYLKKLVVAFSFKNSHTKRVIDELGRQQIDLFG